MRAGLSLRVKIGPVLNKEMRAGLSLRVGQPGDADTGRPARPEPTSLRVKLRRQVVPGEAGRVGLVARALLARGLLDKVLLPLAGSRPRLDRYSVARARLEPRQLGLSHPRVVDRARALEQRPELGPVNFLKISRTRGWIYTIKSLVIFLFNVFEENSRQLLRISNERTAAHVRKILH